MSFIAVIAGTSYTLPTEGDESWGPQTSAWMQAVSTELLQRTGGNFVLTADTNFGPNFATVQAYLKSRTANIASSGFIRLARADSIAWRNQANSADLLLAVNSSNQLTFNGNIIPSDSGGVLQPSQGGTGISSYTVGDIIYASGTTTLSKLNIGTANFVLVSSGSAPTYALLVNANISASAAIAFSKLASLSSGNILVGSSGNVATSVAMSGAITIDNAGATSYNGTVPVNKGGTNITSYTSGDTLYASGSTTLSKLGIGAAGTVYRSDGSVPSWGAFAPNKSQVFTSSGTFNVPALVTAVKVTVIGGGGGGGGCQTNAGGTASEAGGGGGGGCAIKWVTGLTPAGTVTVTVGTGGAGGTAGPNNGSAGNTSSFGAHCSATGGGGGNSGATSSGTTSAAGGAGGAGSSGDLNFAGADGGSGVVAAANRLLLTTGGGTFMAGSVSTSGGAGKAGTGYGGGGTGGSIGASTSAVAGGAGANGVVIVEWIAI